MSGICEVGSELCANEIPLHLHDGEADPWGVLLYLGQQNQQLLRNILLLNRLAKLPMKLPSLLLVMKVVVDKLRREGIEKLFKLLWRGSNLRDLLPHLVPCVPS